MSYSPYIDAEVLNFILSLDYQLKVPFNGNKDGFFESKYLQKELAKGIFPNEIIVRPKQGGAIDLSIHLKDEQITKRIRRKVLSSEIINEYFRAEKIRPLFEEPHRNATKIFLLLGFDLWHLLFFEARVNRHPTFGLLDYI